MNLIIHHWDTDGICSAALIAKMLQDDWTNCTPPIGVFDFDAKVWRLIERAEKIYVVDFNAPDVVEKISKSTVFIDHHVQRRINNEFVIQINPVIDGKYYPSASWIVSEYYHIWNHLSALGAIGDNKNVFATEFGEKIKSLLTLPKDDAIRIVELIDSNYVVMDRKSVEEAVEVVLNSEPRELLNNERWLKNLDLIEQEVQKALDNLVVRQNCAEIVFKSNCNVISKVGRKLVWDMGFDLALVVNKDFNGLAQVYLRAKPDKINILKIIEKLKSMGYKAGGKKEVLGVVCQKSELENVVNTIKEEVEIWLRSSL